MNRDSKGVGRHFQLVANVRLLTRAVPCGDEPCPWAPLLRVVNENDANPRTPTC
jgi:hypothetical protein